MGAINEDSQWVHCPICGKPVSQIPPLVQPQTEVFPQGRVDKTELLLCNRELIKHLIFLLRHMYLQFLRNFTHFLLDILHNVVYNSS